METNRRTEEQEQKLKQGIQEQVKGAIQDKGSKHTFTHTQYTTWLKTGHTVKHTGSKTQLALKVNVGVGGGQTDIRCGVNMNAEQGEHMPGNLG